MGFLRNRRGKKTEGDAVVELGPVKPKEVAETLGISNSGLRRAGLFRDWTGAELKAARKRPPKWLETERARHHTGVEQARAGAQETVRVKLVDAREEEPALLRALVGQYGKGGEFTATEAMRLVSAGYVKWYGEMAKANNTYLIGGGSATLELLESLLAKGLLRDKRTAVRNEYGDEEWYYTVS